MKRQLLLDSFTLGFTPLFMEEDEYSGQKEWPPEHSILQTCSYPVVQNKEATEKILYKYNRFSFEQ